MNRPFGNTNGSIDLMTSFRDFLGPAPGALKDHLNTVELSRIVITSLAAGGSILTLLQAILMNVGTIFPAPTDAALAAVCLTLILEAVRRLNHGENCVPAAAPGLHAPGTNGDTDRFPNR
jgi:hypothetical protein